MWVYDVREVKWAALALMFANLVMVAARLGLMLKGTYLIGRLFSPMSTIKESVRFGLAGAAMPLYLQADKIILLWLMGTGNLGLYSVALSASAAIGSITVAASMVSFTVAAQAQRGDGFERIAKTFRISALLWLVCGGALVAAMDVLLPLVYGREFVAAVNPARLLIVASAFAGFANLLDQSLRGQGRAFIGFEGRVAGLVAIVVASFTLVPWFGLPGMCLAYLLGQTTCFIFFMWRILGHYQQPMSAMSAFIISLDDVSFVFSHVWRMLFKRRLP